MACPHLDSQAHVYACINVSISYNPYQCAPTAMYTCLHTKACCGFLKNIYASG